MFFFRGQRGNGKTWSNNFKFGASETVIARLEEARRAVRQEYTGTQALVLVREHEKQVDQWMDKNVGKLKNMTRNFNYDPSAKKIGLKAGHRVSLNKGIGSSDSVKQVK